MFSALRSEMKVKTLSFPLTGAVHLSPFEDKALKVLRPDGHRGSLAPFENKKDRFLTDLCAVLFYPITFREDRNGIAFLRNKYAQWPRVHDFELP